MNVLPRIIFFIILGIIGFLLINKEKNKEVSLNERSFIVCLPKIAKWVGVLGIVFPITICILMTIYPNDTAEPLVYAEFLAFVLLGIYLFFYAIRWRIFVEDNNIKIIPLFGRENNLTFSDIKKVKITNGGVILYSENKKLVSVDFYSIGFNQLIYRLNEKKIPFVT